MVSNLLIITESMMPFTSNWGACQRIYHYAKKMVSEGTEAVSTTPSGGATSRA